jgi:uncharacterized protein
MIYLLSPAKTLDYESPIAESFSSQTFTLPQFPKESLALSRILRKIKPKALSELMDISPALASLNHERFKSFSEEFTEENARVAFLAFNGDVYDGLNARTLQVDEVTWAQEHVRMLSGLYGVLRPLDLMQPYRLEMGTRLPNKAGKNLYALWTKKTAALLNKDLDVLKSSVVVNLASDEYFKSVDVKKLKAEVIQPVFQERKLSAGANAGYKIVSFSAKKARGLMARYAIDQRIENAQALKEFAADGYKFEPSASTSHRWLFRRQI